MNHESLLAAATHASPVAHLIEDSQGNILYANDAMVDWLGYSVDDLRQMHVIDLAPEHERQRVQANIKKMAGSQLDEITSLKKQYRHRDGRCLWGLLNARTVKDDQGKVRFIVANILDIQTETELQEKLHQKNLELSRANRELDQFAYVASHDLKSPLTGVRRLADWIYEDCEAILPKASQRHLHLLNDRIRRMERMLDDLLAYSRAGKRHYEVLEINLASSAAHILQMLEDGKHFTLDVDDLTIPIQRIPFEMVLRNLIDNSVKHNPSKKGHISIGLKLEQDHYLFKISDNGPGIDPEYQEKVLEMFQRLRSKDEIEGSGMGLALVKKIVESYGGHVEVVSDGINGTEVMIRWPKPNSP